MMEAVRTSETSVYFNETTRGVYLKAVILNPALTIGGRDVNSALLMLPCKNADLSFLETLGGHTGGMRTESLINRPHLFRFTVAA
jgi:hypothetical protein